MRQVIRYDVGKLQAPTRTPQGFLRVDGYASRCGVLEYRDDGAIRRELRLPEDVFSEKSLEGFVGLPVTDDHPSEMVGPDNAQGLMLGTVLGPGRQDGDFVGVTVQVTDAGLIRKMESGKRQLSVGYAVELEDGPGEHPTYGKYDAIQRRIVPNHLAVVSSGRSGPAVSVRMDGLEEIEHEDFDPDQPRDEGGQWGEGGGGGDRAANRVASPTGNKSNDKKLSALSPKQRVFLKAMASTSKQRGSDSKLLAKLGISQGQAVKFAHEIRVSLGLPDGAPLREHVIRLVGKQDRQDCADDELVYELDAEEALVVRDLLLANPMPHSAQGTMDLEQALAKIAELEAKLAAFESKDAKDAAEVALKASEEKAVAAESKATEAETKVDSLTKTVSELEAQLVNARKDAEADKVRIESARKDADDGFAVRVRDRVALETAANAVLGATDKDGKAIDRSAIANRDLKLQIVKHVDGDDVPSDKADPYIDALFDGALKRHAKGSSAVAATAAAVVIGRADAAPIKNLSGADAEAKASAALKTSLSNAWMKSSKETK